MDTASEAFLNILLSLQYCYYLMEGLKRRYKRLTKVISINDIMMNYQ